MFKVNSWLYYSFTPSTFISELVLNAKNSRFLLDNISSPSVRKYPGLHCVDEAFCNSGCKIYPFFDIIQLSKLV